jgi:hypothetical protein
LYCILVWLCFRPKLQKRVNDHDSHQKMVKKRKNLDAGGHDGGRKRRAEEKTDETWATFLDGSRIKELSLVEEAKGLKIFLDSPVAEIVCADFLEYLAEKPKIEEALEEYETKFGIKYYHKSYLAELANLSKKKLVVSLLQCPKGTNYFPFGNPKPGPTERVMRTFMGAAIEADHRPIDESVVNIAMELFPYCLGLLGKGGKKDQENSIYSINQ